MPAMPAAVAAARCPPGKGAARGTAVMVCAATKEGGRGEEGKVEARPCGRQLCMASERHGGP